MGVLPHPLDPLSAAEMTAAAGACRAKAAVEGVERLRFNTISLKVLLAAGSRDHGVAEQHIHAFRGCNALPAGWGWGAQHPSGPGLVASSRCCSDADPPGHLLDHFERIVQ